MTNSKTKSKIRPLPNVLAEIFLFLTYLLVPYAIVSERMLHTDMYSSAENKIFAVVGFVVFLAWSYLFVWTLNKIDNYFE